MNTSELIRQARLSAGLSQRALGELLGMPQSQISRIERYPDRIQLKTLKRVAKKLGVSVHDII